MDLVQDPLGLGPLRRDLRRLGGRRGGGEKRRLKLRAIRRSPAVRGRARTYPTPPSTGAPGGAGTSQGQHPSSVHGRRQPRRCRISAEKVPKTAVCGGVERGPLWYGRAALRGRNHRLVRRVLLLCTGLLLLLGAPATGPAQGPGVGALKEKSATLAARSREAVVQLYALESRLQQARGDLARIDAQAAALARQQDSARRRHRAAQRTMAVAQFRLGRQLRILYEQDEPDPIAVLLGATSLDEAIEGLESISRTARATEGCGIKPRPGTPAGSSARPSAISPGRSKPGRRRCARRSPATAAGLESPAPNAHRTSPSCGQDQAADRLARFRRSNSRRRRRSSARSSSRSSRRHNPRPELTATPALRRNRRPPRQPRPRRMLPSSCRAAAAPVESVCRAEHRPHWTHDRTGAPRPGG